MYIFNRGGRVLCSDWLELISMEKMQKMNFLVHRLLFNVYSMLLFRKLINEVSC
jgi:hypothetical protein